MAAAFPVFDLFAGPGGLGEGFSAFCDSRGDHPFRIVMSVEKEASAFETLRLRSFLRKLGRFPDEYYDFINRRIDEPDWANLYPRQWQEACEEVLQLELGTRGAKSVLKPRFASIPAQASRNGVLIGGPPCQAYSLVGRARNRGIAGYDARKDHRHFLYREYIEVIRHLQPAVFVMENVKGMISSSVGGKEIFDLVLADLRDAGGTADSYRLFALAPGPRNGIEVVSPSNHRSFVVRCEEFGVPQARHRVIVLGLRSDIAVRRSVIATRHTEHSSAIKHREVVRSVLEGLPKLRSGLSSHDSDASWHAEVARSLTWIAGLSRSHRKYRDLSARAAQLRRQFAKKRLLHRSDDRRPAIGTCVAPALKRWILDPRLHVAPNSGTRTHMPSDLRRYLFASIFGEVRGQSPKASDFPRDLSPAHRNWRTGKFSDRFRVQLYDQPSSTITSHISKDGHYFIHPDPLQCRSLTVREAARLQTFPDNYFFKGNRTEQYVQVGNAVPPFLAFQIASVVFQLLKTRRL